MDADERLTALKKAYADVILNTAKEAAARIMVSERKAFRFQQELKATKDQALQMLLRQKQMMDSKVAEAKMAYLGQQRKVKELEELLQNAKNTISEADAASFSQHRKVEELEAQLQEAEDIVKDLREELREVQAELEKVRNNKTQHTGECNTGTHEQRSQENSYCISHSLMCPPPASQLESFITPDMKISVIYQRNEIKNCYNANDYCLKNCSAGKPDIPSTSEEKRLSASQSNIFPPPVLRPVSSTASDIKSSALNQRNEVYKFPNTNDFHLGNPYASKPIIPSIILRGKDSAPYRNRRTQRIRAFEEKLMAGELSFSETIDVNYETSARENGEGEGIYKMATVKADIMCSTEKDEVQAYSSQYQVQKVKPICGKRRRCRRRSTPLSRYPSNQILETDQSPDINCTEANPIKDNAQCMPTQKADTMFSTEETDLVQADNSRFQVQKVKSVHRKRRKIRGKRTPSSRYLSNRVLEVDQTPDITRNEATPVKSNAQCGGNPSNTARRFSVESEDHFIGLGCTKGTESDAEFVKAGSAQNTINKDQPSVDKLLLMAPESEAAESSGVLTDRRDIEKVDEPKLNSDTKESDTPIGIPNQPVTDRVFKYTFQRKRKRDPLCSSDGNASLEKCTSKKKTADKQNGSLEMDKSSLITESSRDSRRLAQVARQLISLSEKKWWQ